MGNTKIRTAVVGAGKMGVIHAKVYDQLPQSDFSAMAYAIFNMEFFQYFRFEKIQFIKGGIQTFCPQ